MTKLSEVPAELDPTHLLLIGQTKMGKSTYCADAVLAGWPMIYVDSDNGLSALRRSLGENKEAMDRVFYFATEKPAKFLDGLVNSGVFRWNLTRDEAYSSAKAGPNDRVVEIKPSMIPNRIILTVDSWSAVSLDAMEVGASNKKTTLESMSGDNKMSQVYGDAGLRLTTLLAILQKCKFHTIIQAHPQYYERLERPAGAQKAEEIKQKDMIVKETTEIPLSCSKPHGFAMGKYFTDIGWLELNRMDERVLSYKVKKGRISGGTLDIEGGVKKLGFANTFQPNPPSPTDHSNWIRYYTHAEFVAEREAAKESEPKKAGPSTSGNALPAKPVNPLLQFGKKA